jgi:G3E family GTPase
MNEAIHTSKDDRRLPVTLLSGYLGAGKTTVLNAILNNRQDIRVAVIVNDMSEVNIDAAHISNEVSLNRTDEKLIEMSNGCICCTLREDLLLEINALAAQNRFDYLLIESTGISEPLPVAETFTFEDEDGNNLAKVARLDTLVTVVDGANFLSDFQEAKDLCDTQESLGEDDERSVADLLIDQIEFCNVILISKTDLISEQQLNEVKATLFSLNPDAKIVPISNGKIAIDEVLNTQLFNYEKAQQSPGWLKELRGEHIPETEQFGISSFVYRARRPFHPNKFFEFLHQDWPTGKLIRSKGFFWLATRPMLAGQWSQAGGIARYGAAGLFWKAIPKPDWPDDAASLEGIHSQWEEPFGDMRQELVFIGQGLNQSQIQTALDECLLSQQEMLQGQKAWRRLPDPFPIWEIEG